MRVNAGSLDKRISIVQEVKEQDPDGYWSIKDRVVHGLAGRGSPAPAGKR